MNTKDIILNFGIPLYMIAIQYGTRSIKYLSLIRTLLTIVGIGIFILTTLPTAGGDSMVYVYGALIGGLLGTIAGLSIRVYKASTGKLFATAGLTYASLWIGVALARFAFAYLSSHNLHHQIADLAIQLRITGKPAVSGFFILLSITMALARSKVLLVKATVAKRATSTASESV